MRILVLNCGSSSLKFQVLEMTGPTTERPVARGDVERIGQHALVRFAREGETAEPEATIVPDHAAAVRRALAWVETAVGARPDAIGHRVVHGGPRFTASARITADVLRAIEELEDLAPLHNRPSVAAIRACRELLGEAMPMVAVFDTTFHTTLPERAARYAIPWELGERHGVRRFGFHGTSYRSVLARYCALTDTPVERATLVALHLGAGSSITAIQHGRSVDTSMGFTPLEGLMMGTRSGDLDPAIVGYLARKESTTVAEVERWLNERSGLLGVSGIGLDMRDLLARDEPRARLAVEMYCYRAKKYLGAYLAALGGAPTVIFTGGVGEHAAEVRARICAGMEWCGLTLDPARNAGAVGAESMISQDRARMTAFVIPTNEESVIARDTWRCQR